ncbi:MAG: hypothetical protein OK422_06440 [Thaumarchaeota archaeon]|nr:hypothetical protein [Nitrososphaerota archaeon]
MSETTGLDYFRCLDYVGIVRSVRQEYQIFKTINGDFLVFSPSNRSPSSFHMTHVSAPRVEELKKIAVGKRVSSTSLLKDKRVHEVFKIEDRVVLRFEILTTLYVMVALNVLEMKKTGRTLVFTPTRSPRDYED